MVEKRVIANDISVEDIKKLVLLKKAKTFSLPQITSLSAIPNAYKFYFYNNNVYLLTDKDILRNINKIDYVQANHNNKNGLALRINYARSQTEPISTLRLSELCSRDDFLKLKNYLSDQNYNINFATVENTKLSSFNDAPQKTVQQPKSQQTTLNNYTQNQIEQPHQQVKVQNNNIVDNTDRIIENKILEDTKRKIKLQQAKLFEKYPNAPKLTININAYKDTTALLDAYVEAYQTQRIEASLGRKKERTQVREQEKEQVQSRRNEQIISRGQTQNRQSRQFLVEEPFEKKQSTRSFEIQKNPKETKKDIDEKVVIRSRKDLIREIKKAEANNTFLNPKSLVMLASINEKEKADLKNLAKRFNKHQLNKLQNQDNKIYSSDLGLTPNNHENPVENEPQKTEVETMAPVQNETQSQQQTSDSDLFQNEEEMRDTNNRIKLQEMKDNLTKQAQSLQNSVGESQIDNTLINEQPKSNELPQTDPFGNPTQDNKNNNSNGDNNSNNGDGNGNTNEQTTNPLDELTAPIVDEQQTAPVQEGAKAEETKKEEKAKTESTKPVQTPTTENKPEKAPEKKEEKKEDKPEKKSDWDSTFGPLASTGMFIGGIMLVIMGVFGIVAFPFLALGAVLAIANKPLADLAGVPAKLLAGGKKNATAYNKKHKAKHTTKDYDIGKAYGKMSKAERKAVKSQEKASIKNAIDNLRTDVAKYKKAEFYRKQNKIHKELEEYSKNRGVNKGNLEKTDDIEAILSGKTYDSVYDNNGELKRKDLEDIVTHGNELTSKDKKLEGIAAELNSDNFMDIFDKDGKIRKQEDGLKAGEEKKSKKQLEREKKKAKKSDYELNMPEKSTDTRGGIFGDSNRTDIENDELFKEEKAKDELDPLSSPLQLNKEEITTPTTEEEQQDAFRNEIAKELNGTTEQQPYAKDVENNKENLEQDFYRNEVSPKLDEVKDSYRKDLPEKKVEDKEEYTKQPIEDTKKSKKEKKVEKELDNKTTDDALTQAFQADLKAELNPPAEQKEAPKQSVMAKAIEVFKNNEANKTQSTTTALAPTTTPTPAPAPAPVDNGPSMSK